MRKYIFYLWFLAVPKASFAFFSLCFPTSFVVLIFWGTGLLYPLFLIDERIKSLIGYYGNPNISLFVPLILSAAIFFVIGLLIDHFTNKQKKWRWILPIAAVAYSLFNDFLPYIGPFFTIWVLWLLGKHIDFKKGKSYYRKILPILYIVIGIGIYIYMTYFDKTCG